MTKTGRRVSADDQSRRQAERGEDDAGLNLKDRHDVEDHQRLRAPVVYEIIRQEGAEELERPAASLWWSGIAAGLAISTSVYCEAFIHNHLPDTTWRPLIENFGYCVGFVIVILGGFQLFTEQTVTAVLPLLAKPTAHNLACTARLWVIVFLANMVGTFFSAGLGLVVGLVDPEKLAAVLEVSRHFADQHPLKILLLGMPAGFFIAALVWVMPSCEGNEFWVITMLTYMIALGDLTHVVAGSTEVFLLLLTGEESILNALFGIILPALIGNIVGGTLLFSLIAYGQVRKELDHT